METHKTLIQELLQDDRLTRIRAAIGPNVPLYLVGGCLRDALRGQYPSDLDLASPLLPEELVRLFERAGVRVIPTGLRHQTVTTVPVLHQPGVEITTFRGPLMRPEGGVVASPDIHEDLRYRDFTMNALACDAATGAIIDDCGGTADIAARIIRAVGDARERFSEDPLRVLRMVRFASTMGFTIDPQTASCAPAAIPLLRSTSIERIRDEFSKTLTGIAPATGLTMLASLGVFSMFLPELEECRGFEQNEFHRADVFDHTVEVVQKTSPDLVLRLAALFHDVGKPPTLTIDETTGARHFFKHESVGGGMTRSALERLRFPHSVIGEVVTLVETHMRPIEAGAGGIRRLLRDTSALYPKWRELKEADASSCRLDDQELQVRLAVFDANVAEVLAGPAVSPLKSLALNGRDLMAMGIPEGREIGEILRGLHERVLDAPELNTAQALTALIPQIRAMVAASAQRLTTDTE